MPTEVIVYKSKGNELKKTNGAKQMLAIYLFTIVFTTACVFFHTPAIATQTSAVETITEESAQPTEVTEPAQPTLTLVPEAEAIAPLPKGVDPITGLPTNRRDYGWYTLDVDHDNDYHLCEFYYYEDCDQQWLSCALPEPTVSEQAEAVSVTSYTKQTKKLLLSTLKTRGIWQSNYSKLTKADIIQLLTEDDRYHAA